MLVESIVILCGGKGEHRVVRVGGLDDGKAGLFCTAAASHHLCDQAEHVLVCTEALREQQRIDAQNTHKGHVLEIQTFCHHLGAHHDVVFMRCKFGKQLFVGVLGGSGVLIHAQHPRLREELCQFLLSFLSAEAAVLQFTAAGRAKGGRRLLLGAAIVAQHLAGRFVVHHGHAALGALEHLAAVLALGNGLVAPAVEQKNGLLFCVQIAADGILQRKADLPGVARSQFCPHIHDLHAGQRVAAVALCQAHQLGTSVLRSVEALGAGGGAGQKQQCAVFGSTLPGDLVGGVARCGFRPVGVLLLFVNDDKADIFQR